MSLEFVLTPESRQQGTILTFSGDGKAQLQFAQEGNSLLARSAAGTASVSWPGLLVAGKALHLVANLDGKHLEIFANGKSVGKKKMKVDLASATIDTFYLGDTTGALGALLSGIAVYDQQLNPTEIATNSRLAEVDSAKGAAAETLIVEGTVQETTEIPAPDAIGAYRRALVVNTYAVDRVVQGVYGQNRVLVAEWAILDRNIIKSYQTPARPEQLVLEKFTENPQLEGERQMMDVFEPELEMYYRLPKGLVN
ncbi:MAG: LamG domain-containing protein [Proteobacteria bacterium]|nr:LamG domain-containing protein [Pseudomonadota bacterium]